MNRLKTADATGGASPWGLTYDYDAWGNFHDRGVTAGSGLLLDVTPNLKNQLVDPGYDYDLAGNMIEKPDPVMNYNQEYDAENRLVKVTQGATVLGEYKYDGDGNRVQKIVSGTKTIYFRSAADGSVRKEFVNSGSGYAVDRVYAYLNGSHLASYSPPLGGGWKYTFRDHLGTLRVRTRSWGAIVSRHDFYPFGGEHTPPSADEDHLFTDQERDAETGLDYFIARHYGNNIGRFLQIDPGSAGASPGDPQSWNAYAYVLNNPLTYVDPLGLSACGDKAGGGANSKAICGNVMDSASEDPSLAGGSHRAKLVQLQDAARGNPALQAGQPDAQGNPSTWCNRGTACVVAGMGASTEEFMDPTYNEAASANVIADNLASSENWVNVTPEQAQAAANAGVVAVGAFKNPVEGRAGHVVTVRPTNVRGDKIGDGANGPLVNHIGTTTGVRRASGAFMNYSSRVGKKVNEGGIRFYVPKTDFKK